MANENKISRRTFLKGLAATGAVATTGIASKAGPDKFTTMLTDLKKDFRSIRGVELRSHALGMPPPTIKKMLQAGEITKSFANKILPLSHPNLYDPTGEKYKLKEQMRAQFKEQYKKLVPAYNEKLAKTRGYAEKNNKMVAIYGNANVKNLKPGEKVTYNKGSRIAAMQPGAGISPQITTPQKKKPKRKPKSAVKGGRGAGAGANQEGVHTIFEGPKLVKVKREWKHAVKDFRKGGMVLSTMDNRKKR